MHVLAVPYRARHILTHQHRKTAPKRLRVKHSFDILLYCFCQCTQGYGKWEPLDSDTICDTCRVRGKVSVLTVIWAHPRSYTGVRYVLSFGDVFHDGEGECHNKFKCGLIATARKTTTIRVPNEAWERWSKQVKNVSDAVVRKLNSCQPCLSHGRGLLNTDVEA